MLHPEGIAEAVLVKTRMICIKYTLANAGMHVTFIDHTNSNIRCLRLFNYFVQRTTCKSVSFLVLASEV